jgi:hypothetical protein
MPGAFTHTSITWAFSPPVPQVPGVNPGSPLCPWCFGHPLWRGARQQRHLVIFRPRHKHDLPWWHNATFFVSNIRWFSSLGATFVGRAPLACLLCWYTSPNLFGLLASEHFSTQAFCGEVRMTSFPGYQLQCFVNLHAPSNLKRIGNLNKVSPPPIFAFSSKKKHFFAKLSILSVAFIGAFKSSS